MFCKNARSIIAMASDSKPGPSPSVVKDLQSLSLAQAVPSKDQLQQQIPQTKPSMKQSDSSAELFLRNQQLDPTLQLFLQQQLTMCQKHQPQQQVSTFPQQLHQLHPQQLFHQQQQRAVHHPSLAKPSNRILAYGDGTHQVPSALAMNQSVSASNNGDQNLWQQIHALKQQEAQMMQLRQLMALNLQRQQNRKSGAKNFRASAA
jgi:hypothetical protein